MKIHSCLARLGAAGLFFLTASVPASRAFADAPAGGPCAAAYYLCHSDSRPVGGPFACQRRQANGRRQVLLFQGGPAPRAIRTEDGQRKQEHWLSAEERGGWNCQPERPFPVPPGAIYRGTGVCEDAHGRSLPCSLFEHAAARQPDAMRYMAFYHPEGRGVREIEVMPMGPNEPAFEAELAFRIGLALLRSACCRHRAQGWLTHAVGLYPDEPDYNAAWSCAKDPLRRLAASETGPAKERRLMCGQRRPLRD